MPRPTTESIQGTCADLLEILRREKPEWFEKREPVTQWDHFIKVTVGELKEIVADGDGRARSDYPFDRPQPESFTEMMRRISFN